MELEKFKEYIAVQLDNSSLRRIPKSKISWLWHDEDELLRYQPDLLQGFHQRFVVRLYLYNNPSNSRILIGSRL